MAHSLTHTLSLPPLFRLQTRALSTSATALAEAPAKAPIQVFGVNGRYAHALFSAASKKKVLPQVEKELKEVKV